MTTTPQEEGDCGWFLTKIADTTVHVRYQDNAYAILQVSRGLGPRALEEWLATQQSFLWKDTNNASDDHKKYKPLVLTPYYRAYLQSLVLVVRDPQFLRQAEPHHHHRPLAWTLTHHVLVQGIPHTATLLQTSLHNHHHHHHDSVRVDDVQVLQTAPSNAMGHIAWLAVTTTTTMTTCTSTASWPSRFLRKWLRAAGHAVLGQAQDARRFRGHKLLLSMGRLQVTWMDDTSTTTTTTVVETEPPTRRFTHILAQETQFWQARHGDDTDIASASTTSTTTPDIPLPRAYRQGQATFGPLTLHVTPAVMIPRPTSYTVVECAFQLWREQQQQCQQTTKTPIVVDLGTGSGCLLLALQHLLESTNPHAAPSHYYGVDSSADALAVAQTNDTTGKCTWIHASFADDKDDSLLSLLPHPANLIVCNPPYHLESSRTILDASYRHHEPSLALFVPTDTETNSNDDGDDVAIDPILTYKQAWQTVHRMADPTGAVVGWEICPYNAHAVYTYFCNQPEFCQISVARDAKGIIRSLQGIYRTNNRTTDTTAVVTGSSSSS